jgi:hypothetical protein
MTYSRLKRKPDADRELAIFKRLEEARKRGDSSLEGSAVDQQPAPVLPQGAESRSEKPNK